MILNPPPVITILRSWDRLMSKAQQELLSSVFAVLLRQYLPPLTWDQFLQTYTLYFQSIPFAVARAAWGINHAKASQTHQPPL